MSVESTDRAVGAAQATPPAASDQIRRWRAPLVVLALTALSYALVSGSVLLFFGSFVASREYWGFTHWLLAMIGLVPYALYQLRHYLRVRQYVQQTHYRVGLHSFFMICGTVLSGLIRKVAREATVLNLEAPDQLAAIEALMAGEPRASEHS